MLKTLKDFNVKNKRVLVRCDFNVPLSDKGEILDDFRIKQTMPTIEFLIKKGARIIMLDKRKLEFIFKHYEFKNQLDKLSEECDELFVEIQQAEFEAYSNLKTVLEEMADVYVLISQFMTVPEYKEKILKEANKKIARQLRRIYAEKEKKVNII